MPANVPLVLGTLFVLNAEARFVTRTAMCIFIFTCQYIRSSERWCPLHENLDFLDPSIDRLCRPLVISENFRLSTTLRRLDTRYSLQHHIKSPSWCQHQHAETGNNMV